MQLQYENQEAVPEDLRESFVEFKDGDNTVFMHKDLAETKKEAFRFKGDLTHAQKAAQEKAERLAQLEEAEKQRQADKELAELESKKKNGQHEEILEDFKTKAQQREEALNKELEELRSSIKNKEKSNTVTELASVGTDKTRTALKRLIDSDLAFSDDGGLVVMQDGKATSMTIDEYKSKLPDLYPTLVSESHGKGGISTGGAGSATTAGNKKRSAMTREEKHSYIQEHGQKEFLKLPK